MMCPRGLARTASLIGTAAGREGWGMALSLTTWLSAESIFGVHIGCNIWIQPIVKRGRGIQRSEKQAFFLRDRKSTRLNSSHLVISYAVFCLKKNNHTATS